MAFLGFNPRPRVGGDAVLAGVGFEVYGFNPRPRVGGDDLVPETAGAYHEFQSSPPRRGRPRHHIYLLKNENAEDLREPDTTSIVTRRRASMRPITI